MPARCRPTHDKHYHLREPFGYLLTLDLYGCRPCVCDDLNLCYDFLVDLVHDLGMTAQGPPHIYRSPLEFPDKAGLSGWIGMIESGIQIHTLTPRSFISIDIYCCRDFTSDGVTEFVRDYFGGCREIEMNRILRGMKYNEVV